MKDGGVGEGGMRRGREEKWGSSRLASGGKGKEIDLGFKDGKRKIG